MRLIWPAGFATDTTRKTPVLVRHAISCGHRRNRRARRCIGYAVVKEPSARLERPSAEQVIDRQLRKMLVTNRESGHHGQFTRTATNPIGYRVNRLAYRIRRSGVHIAIADSSTGDFCCKVWILDCHMHPLTITSQRNNHESLLRHGVIIASENIL